jgi:hypothetical protein
MHQQEVVQIKVQGKKRRMDRFCLQKEKFDVHVTVHCSPIPWLRCVATGLATCTHCNLVGTTSIVIVHILITTCFFIAIKFQCNSIYT